MATLKVIGSGSQQGNTYILEAGNEHLLLDLGCKWSDIMQGLNYDISNCFALVTHLHGDHAKYIPQALKSQIPVYSNQEVADKFQDVKVLKPKVQYKIGGFVVMALPVQHNCDNYSYLITHEEFGSLVLCTDAISFPCKIKGLNHLMIESNYSEDLMIDNLCRNQEIRSHNEFHMEINQTIEAIKRNMNPELRTLMLVHLSDGQSDEKLFQKMVFDEVGIRPIIADENVIVELNSEDF